MQPHLALLGIENIRFSFEIIKSSYSFILLAN